MAKDIAEEDAGEAAAAEGGQGEVGEGESFEQVAEVVGFESAIELDPNEPIGVLPHFFEQNAAVVLQDFFVGTEQGLDDLG